MHLSEKFANLYYFWEFAQNIFNAFWLEALKQFKYGLVTKQKVNLEEISELDKFFYTMQQLLLLWLLQLQLLLMTGPNITDFYNIDPLANKNFN